MDSLLFISSVHIKEETDWMSDISTQTKLLHLKYWTEISVITKNKTFNNVKLIAEKLFNSDSFHNSIAMKNVHKKW